MVSEIGRHQTAIRRTGFSRPIRLAYEAGLIGVTTSVFDFGCGRGDDLSLLRGLCIPCSGWDPVHCPGAPRLAADVVNLGFVINVIEDPVERAQTLLEAWRLTRRVLLVAARLSGEKDPNYRVCNDGCMTQRGTFQKFFSQQELRDWINAVLHVECVVAGPGIVFVFRDEQLHQSFVLRSRRRTSSLSPQQANVLIFSADNLDAVNKACVDAPCGKLTHDALYVHVAGIPSLPTILREYEGHAKHCAGMVDEANIVKFHRRKLKVSYLAYPEFDNDPHPALADALVVSLGSADVKSWDYRRSANPPILHRKEEFVPASYPGRDKFARLTKQEERWGLLDDTRRIGHREEWHLALKSRNVEFRGHRLIRRRDGKKANQ